MATNIFVQFVIVKFLRMVSVQNVLNTFVGCTKVAVDYQHLILKQVLANKPATGTTESRVNEDSGIAGRIIRALKLGNSSEELSDSIFKNKLQASDLISIIIHLFQVLRERNNSNRSVFLELCFSMYGI